MNQIVRVQNPEGKGIYGWFTSAAGKPERASARLMSSFSSRHPIPSMDVKLYKSAPHLFSQSSGCFNAYDFIFGFADFRQFRIWLHDDSILEELNLRGFQIYIMQGEVFHGDTQSVIHKDTAITLHEYSFAEYLDQNKRIAFYDPH